MKERRKEPEFKESFKTEDIVNLSDIMKKIGSNYRAESPIYDRQTDRLLLNRGKSVSEERFEELKRRISSNIRKGNESPYYTERKREDFDF